MSSLISNRLSDITPAGYTGTGSSHRRVVHRKRHFTVRLAPLGGYRPRRRTYRRRRMI